MLKIGINGFGRIGRIVARQLYSNPDFAKKLQIVAVNDMSSPEELAFLFKRDSVHGTWKGTVTHDKESITINGNKIAVLKQTDPTQLPWGQLGAEVVFECTGRFTDREGAAQHLKGGAKRVVVSAPAKGVDLTIVMGVNHKLYDPSKHVVVSNASCTTNCLAPVVHVLHEKFGIQHGLMTTVHSYTSDQRIIDNTHKDLRRARTAGLNMIPTSTGAAKTVGEVLPALKGKLDGHSVRVPTADVSFTDFVATLSKPVTPQEVNDALKAAAQGDLKGILDVTDEPLVSSDFIGNTYSSTVDAQLTQVMSGTMVKVCSWYDNEVGFSTRMLDLATLIASKN
jgi:glyceraldehyde 3-phosphate dehydrogenase